MAREASSQDFAHSARERIALSLGTSFFRSLRGGDIQIINLYVAHTQWGEASP